MHKRLSHYEKKGVRREWEEGVRARVEGDTTAGAGER